MRHLALVLLAAALPSSGFAQDAVIRIEAKRGVDAATRSAEDWRTRFDDVVTFPLTAGWVGIALGPLPRAEADARLAQLKRAGQVPADSFVAVPATDLALSPVRPTPIAAADPAPSEATGGAAEPDAPIPLPAIEAADPGSYIRLQSLQDRAKADQALAEWRETFAEAGMWGAADGWFTIALGPMADDTAQAWLVAFKKAGLAAKDAFVSDAADLGPAVIEGTSPGLPAPADSRPLPPLEEVQRALRWAGRYDGAIDGKTGPKTEGAILAEIAGARLSPDPGTAMQKLIGRRAEWRREMGLSTLEDEATGLLLSAPMDRLSFDRTERSLSIYGPKDGSGAALILFSQPGGQQELLDMTGLATALGWVPAPTRTVSRGHVLLEGTDNAHIGRAEGWVRDGRAEGFILIWPAADPENQRRIAAEMSDSLKRTPAPQPIAPVDEPAVVDSPLATSVSSPGIVSP